MTTFHMNTNNKEFLHNLKFSHFTRSLKCLTIKIDTLLFFLRSNNILRCLHARTSFPPPSPPNSQFDLIVPEWDPLPLLSWPCRVCFDGRESCSTWGWKRNIKDCCTNKKQRGDLNTTHLLVTIKYIKKYFSIDKTFVSMFIHMRLLPSSLKHRTMYLLS